MRETATDAGKSILFHVTFHSLPPLGGSRNGNGSFLALCTILAIVRDAQRRRRLIRHLIDMNGHIADPSMDALNESDRVVPAVNDMLPMNRDILASVAPQQFR